MSSFTSNVLNLDKFFSFMEPGIWFDSSLYLKYIGKEGCGKFIVELLQMSTRIQLVAEFVPPRGDIIFVPTKEKGGKGK